MPRLASCLPAILFVLTALAALSGSKQALAKEEKWTHYGLRPLGMGNAFVAVADDYNALFYNPAGLARITEWTGEFLNPYAEISNSTRTFLSDAMALGDGSAGDTEAILKLIESETGNVQHLALGMTPHLIFPNFGFALGIDLSSTMIFHRYPTIEMDAGPTVTIPIGFAFNLLENRLSLGFNVKARIEGGINHEFSLQDVEAFTTKKEEKEIDEGETAEEDKKISDYIEGGRGFGADVGLLFTPIKTMGPTIGISIADIGGMTYEQMNFGGSAKGKPKSRLPAVNTGFSLKPVQNGSTYVLLAADAHAINQPYSFSKKLNFGSELGLARTFKMQLGLHQGYLSGGFQFDVRLLKVRFVTYSEEMGGTAGTLEDRRYALQLKLLI